MMVLKLLVWKYLGKNISKGAEWVSAPSRSFQISRGAGASTHWCLPNSEGKWYLPCHFGQNPQKQGAEKTFLPLRWLSAILVTGTEKETASPMVWQITGRRDTRNGNIWVVSTLTLAWMDWNGRQQIKPNCEMSGLGPASRVVGNTNWVQWVWKIRGGGRGGERRLEGEWVRRWEWRGGSSRSCGEHHQLKLYETLRRINKNTSFQRLLPGH